MSKTFTDINSLRKDIMKFNDTIFSNVLFGLFQRKDKNISFRMIDRFKPKGKVGLNFDFNLMENLYSFKDSELDINVIIRKDSGDLFDALKNNFNIEKKGTKRSTYDVGNKNLDYIGEIHIKDLLSLEKLLNICYDHLKN